MIQNKGGDKEEMSERARYGHKDSGVVSRVEGRRARNGRRVHEACQDMKVSMLELV